MTVVERRHLPDPRSQRRASFTPLNHVTPSSPYTGFACKPISEGQAKPSSKTLRFADERHPFGPVRCAVYTGRQMEAARSLKEELKAVKHMLRVKAAEAEHAQHRAEAWEREASQWRAAAEKGKPVPLHNPSSSSSGWGLAFSNAAQQDVRSPSRFHLLTGGSMVSLRSLELGPLTPRAQTVDYAK